MPITEQGMSQAKRYKDLYEYRNRVQVSRRASSIVQDGILTFTVQVDPRYYIPGLSDTQ